ncbi:hypothetical protein BJ684DRAFT_19934 [Piptocephalis cylindrospora]|uniref:RxLR effector protein n=1 Tax=Piptocephalis cylindrospora TaxID=1907219 RepID=A0A4P9Y3Q3_9FUNG|nr:hypothetical protein BJ684DRAFT_19934 [Piptocephalis cylindrospora]|eukprot:RKP13588.1 hypothetical protein BJ684DRAFT_19934 [Piptocephalis cylindrospora]
MRLSLAATLLALTLTSYTVMAAPSRYPPNAGRSADPSKYLSELNSPTGNHATIMRRLIKASASQIGKIRDIAKIRKDYNIEAAAIKLKSLMDHPEDPSIVSNLETRKKTMDALDNAIGESGHFSHYESVLYH